MLISLYSLFPIGRPSIATVYVTTIPGYVILTFSVQYSGVINNTISFLVNVSDISSGEIIKEQEFTFADYTNDEHVDAMMMFPNGGMFIFSVLSRNQFGIAEDEYHTEVVIVESSECNYSIIT